MRKNQNRFFTESTKIDEKLILELIGWMTLFKKAFDQQLEKANGSLELQAASERAQIRLETLYKIKENLPVLAADLELLLQFGQLRNNPLIANYPYIYVQQAAQH